MELETQYEPQKVEPAIAEVWERSGALRSKPAGERDDKTFVIVIPPPNVTGALHLGHALNGTLQDILVRYHRMRGFNTLWQPGTDHAGIATQAVVERRIRELEGKSRHDLGREELVRRIWAWKDEYEQRILNQLKSMGCSCDWERNAFTLDDARARAVRHQFFNMFKDGLIFRGKRLVNWDTDLQTAVANDEVYYETVKGHFWHFKYPVIDPKAGEPTHVLIATTRPETMLGDTAVAVCPYPAEALDRFERRLRDSLATAPQRDRAGIETKLDAVAGRRESHLELLTTLSNMARDGRKIMLPLVEREIPLIADEWADPLLGSGCVKITPAHDPNDYEVAQRHDLPMINVLTPDGNVASIVEPDGTTNPHSDSYAGLRFSTEGRKKVVADLESRGLLEKVEDRETEIGHSDRSKTPIEPFLSDQWFVLTRDIPEPQASACAKRSTSGITRSSLDVRPRSPDLSYGATLLTWTTYGTWLPGDDRGSVSRAPRADGIQALRNLPGEPYDRDEPYRAVAAGRRMEGKPVHLQREHAPRLLWHIAETCERHGIELLAVAIMANHVHVLCQGGQHGAELLQLIKGNASKRLNEEFTLKGSPRWWAKSGSRRRIKDGADLTAAIEYVQQQEFPLIIWSFDESSGDAVRIVEEARESVGSASAEVGAVLADERFAQAKACGSDGVRLGDGSTAPGLAQAAIDAVTDDRVKIFPDRYRKSYLDWLGEKRDWCISRQLWWGHRIEIRTFEHMTAHHRFPDETHEQSFERHARETTAKLDRVFSLCNVSDDVTCVWLPQLIDGKKVIHICGRTKRADEAIDGLDRIVSHRRTGNVELDQEMIAEGNRFRGQFGEEAFQYVVASPPSVQLLERDPDVLDTWFSSALWPFSTLGWPEETAHLKQYYPSSVLITSRDIITNWVARMVMFGLYATGKVPFDHVYIHPKILDGRGETMSKSKGNGVDPLDIIKTHGADALRYAMADMTTETQDIRMPVEYICPHCEKLVDQVYAIKAEQQRRKSRGEKLDRKLQPADCAVVTCSHKECGKEFATRWAEPDQRGSLPVACETSDKFDIGRNFCNKLWNAVRFACMNLEGAPCDKLDVKALPPEDRWILAKLSQSIRRYHACLRDYQYSASVKELREFFWDCLCDWYIELTKPRMTGEGSDAQRDTARQILALCTDQILRLLHPTIPFITERLWDQLNCVAPKRGLAGIVDLACHTPLIQAAFPPVEGYPAFDDEEIITTFGEFQDVTRGVRDLRNNANISPRRKVTVTVVVPSGHVASFQASAHIVRHMANIAELNVTTQVKRPANAASITVRGLRIYVHDISDDAAELARTVKALTALDKQIAGKQGKLANDKFLANAKPEVVEAERGRLAELLSQKDAIAAHLAELGDSRHL